MDSFWWNNIILYCIFILLLSDHAIFILLLSALYFSANRSTFYTLTLLQIRIYSLIKSLITQQTFLRSNFRNTRQQVKPWASSKHGGLGWTKQVWVCWNTNKIWYAIYLRASAQWHYLVDSSLQCHARDSHAFLHAYLGMFPYLPVTPTDP